MTFFLRLLASTITVSDVNLTREDEAFCGVLSDLRLGSSFASEVVDFGRPHGDMATLGSTNALLRGVRFVSPEDFVNADLFTVDCFADAPIVASSCLQDIARFLARRGDLRNGSDDLDGVDDFDFDGDAILDSSCWIRRFVLWAICLRDGVVNTMI